MKIYVLINQHQFQSKFSIFNNEYYRIFNNESCPDFNKSILEPDNNLFLQFLRKAMDVIKSVKYGKIKETFSIKSSLQPPYNVTI